MAAFIPVRPEFTRVAMKSSLPLVVDVYWLRAVHAVGTAKTEAEHRNLADYARVLTTLDPDFKQVYWLLGLTIPFNRAREDFANGDMAIALLEQACARFPQELRFKLLLGYSLMTFTTRYTDAAREFEDASHLPGAPPFAALLATRLYLKGDRYDTALALAQSMMEAAGSEQERAAFEDRVRELNEEKILRVFDAAGAEFKKQTGHYPTDVQELVGLGLIQMPEDPQYANVRFDVLGRALLPHTRGRMKVFHDSYGGADADAPETIR